MFRANKYGLNSIYILLEYFYHLNLICYYGFRPWAVPESRSGPIGRHSLLANLGQVRTVLIRARLRACSAAQD